MRVNSIIITINLTLFQWRFTINFSFLHSSPPFSSLLDEPISHRSSTSTWSHIISHHWERGVASIQWSLHMHILSSICLCNYYFSSMIYYPSHPFFSPLEWSTLEEVSSACDYVESLSRGMDTVVGKLIAGGRDSVRSGVIGSAIHGWMGLGGWKTTGDTTTSRDYRIAVGICDRLMGWHWEGMR